MVLGAAFDDEADAPALDAALERARSLARESGTAEQRAWVESVAAQVLKDRGEFVGARECLGLALELAPARARPDLHLELADLEQLAGRISAARAALRAATAALAVAEQPADEEQETRLRAAGLELEVALRLGQYDLAALAAQRVGDLTPPDDAEGRILHALQLANLHLALEDFDFVIEICSRHMTAAEDVDPTLAAQLLVRRGIAESETARNGGDPVRACETLRSALLHPGLSSNGALEVREVLVDLALRRSDSDEARTLLDELGQPASIEARARVAALRMRLALDAGADRAVLEAGHGALLQSFELSCGVFEREREREGAQALGFLAWGTQRMVLSALIRAEIALHPGEAGVRRALEHCLRAQGLGGLAHALGVSGELGVPDVQEALTSEGAGVLVWMPAMDRTHVFAIDAERAIHDEGESRDAILAAGARGLVPRLQAPASRDASPRERAKALAELAGDLTQKMLPDDIRERLEGWSEVRVVGADLCGNPPIELLRLRSDRELGLEKPVSYLPSLPAGIGLARRLRERAGLPVDTRIVAVVDPEFDPRLVRTNPRLVRLQLDSGEIEQIVGGSGRPELRLLQGRAATSAALAAELERGAGLLLLLAHGLHDPTRELPAGLALALESPGDGALWCDAVSALRAPPTVALLACGTARGRARLGDDAAQHLGGAFLMAGADGVIVTRGELGLNAALRLAQVLRRGFEEGRPPAHALLEARRELARDPATSDPFHRVGVLLYGFSPSEPPGRTPRPGPAAQDPVPFGALAAGALVLAAAAIAWIIARPRSAA